MNNSKIKTNSNIIDIALRKTTYKEVDEGYNDEQAMSEADRCLNCKTKPCMEGCPIHNDIPSFIEAIKKQDYENGYLTLKKTSLMPYICARVCAQEKQCEKNCTRAKTGDSVAIGELERYLVSKCEQYDSMPLNIIPLNGLKVALIGSGPSSLACAEVLIKEGYECDVYESLPFLGGLLMFGIPAFRLPKENISNKIQYLKNLGVKFYINKTLGKDFTLNDLKTKYDYVYLGIGAMNSKKMGIDGEQLHGVYLGNEYLKRMNCYEYYLDDELAKEMRNIKNVVVVGGGNVAMDVSRVALRNGANVNLVYRRSEQEAPCRPLELRETKEEGVCVNFLTNPVAIKGKDNVEAVIVRKMELGEPDESGRRSPHEIIGSDYEIPCDAIIYAIGNDLDKNGLCGIATQKYIVVDDNGLTNIPHVYAGGDAVTGPNTVVHAIAQGKKIANQIIKENKK